MSEGIQGLDKLLAQINQIGNLDLVSAEIDGVEVFAAEAKVLVPVDEGNLRDSIGVEVDGDAVMLVAGGGSLPVDYAEFVEFGTSKMNAIPFMRPAIDTKQKEALKAVASNLNAQMRRIAS